MIARGFLHSPKERRLADAPGRQEQKVVSLQIPPELSQLRLAIEEVDSSGHCPGYVPHATNLMHINFVVNHFCCVF
jgi:hypothetical protein